MYQMKKCAKCGKQATHKFTRIQDGQIYDIYLCSDHAAEASPYQKPKIPLPLSDLLEGLLKREEMAQKGSGPVAPSGLRCSHCGLPFEAYKKNLMLGCSECYVSFREFLIQDLRKIHGDTRHRGRQPGGGQAQPPRPEALPEAVADKGPAAETQKVPSATKGGDVLLMDVKEAIAELTRTMNRAIADEDFVKAARCRDMIREMRAKFEKSQSKGISAPPDPKT